MKRTIHNHVSFVIGVAMTLFISSTSYAGGELDRYRNQNPTQAHELHRDNNHGPYVLPLGSKPFGQSYAEWAADFVRWAYSIPYDQNPAFNSALSNCTTPQHGKVWFIATGAASASCEIPKQKAIFVQLGSYVDTYPCPDPAFKPSPGQTLEEFLITDAKYYVDTLYPTYVGQLYHELAIDGKLVVDNGLEQRLNTKLFRLTGDLSIQAVDSCVTGTKQWAVADGYWALVDGLTPGIHKIEFLQQGLVMNTI
ncbi:MAG TPA: hypothetical protein VIJ25_12855, partial [Methylococcales bacterium]